ncbi:MAG: ribokinase [Acidobacteria bacterium]|nr:ribokinase [Acidobacteriota bacterium]
MGLNAVDHLCVVPRYPEFNTKTKILEYQRLPGGQVATALVTCARMGLKAKYLGKVGSDELGRVSLESIAREGIDVSAVIQEPDSLNQFAFIIIDRESGERTILWDRDSKLMYRPGELNKEEVCAGRILHLDGHDLPASIQAARWAREAGIPTVADLDRVQEGMEELLGLVDFLISSANFPPQLTGEKRLEKALRAERQFCPGFIAATMGEEGAMALVGDDIIYFPAFRVRTVDTTGAGDAFHGAFIYGLLRGWPLKRTMVFSHATAALKCMKVGARTGIPGLPQVELFLREQGDTWKEP